MKKFFLIFPVLLSALIGNGYAQDVRPLRLQKTIPLKNISGRVDHLAVDVKGNRLFLAALENNTVEVIDLLLGRHLGSIKGLHKPQGLLYIPEFDKLYVANEENGTLDIYQGTSLAFVWRIKFQNNADHIRYDEAAKLVYVDHGKKIAVIDAVTDEVKGGIFLDGHPESFALEKRGQRLFANIPAAGEIAVIDSKKKSVISIWRSKDSSGNYSMALDEAHRRLFVGFRNPPVLAVFDTETGRLVAQADSGRDSDDLFYDPVRRYIYNSCGEGLIYVYQQVDLDHYRIIAKIRSSPGARTSLFVAEHNRFYVAVPAQGEGNAEVRVYEINYFS